MFRKWQTRETKDVLVKKIGSRKYAFDKDGMMMSGWVDGRTTPASEAKGNFRTEDSGAMRTGWFKAVPWKNLDGSAYDEDSEKWFYANTDGTLKHDVLYTINGKKYAFGKNGEMVTGLKAVKLGANNTISEVTKIDNIEMLNTFAENPDYAIYYFGGSNDGAMKTGNQNVEVDGETYQFLFDKEGDDKGQGVNKVDGGDTNPKAIYVGGRKLKADSDYRYMAVKVKSDGKGGLKADLDLRGDDGPISFAELEAKGLDNEQLKDYMVINTSGVVQKSGEKKDSDGITYKVNGYRIVEFVPEKN